MKIRRKESGLIHQKLKIFLVFLFFISLTAGSSFGSDSAKAINKFKSGNKYYKDSDYTQAIDNYEKVVSLGYESGNLYYNLGNSYFKKGDLGKALLNYEKAKRFIPGDNDLIANYNYARSLVKLNGSKPGSKLFLLGFFDLLSFDQSTIVLSLIYIIICAAVWVLAAFKVSRKGVIAFICFCTIIFVLLTFSLQHRVSFVGNEAIVLDKNIDVKFEPDLEATRYFTVYEGMKVKVIKVQGLWSKIERFDKKIGWVENSAIEIF